MTMAAHKKVKELDHREFLCKTFWKFKTQKVFTDVDFVCDDGVVHCHRAIIVGIFKLWGICLDDKEGLECLIIPNISVSEIEYSLRMLYLHWDSKQLFNLFHQVQNKVEDAELLENKLDIAFANEEVSKLSGDIEGDIKNSDSDLFEIKEEPIDPGYIDRVHTNETVITDGEVVPKKRSGRGRPKGKKDSTKRQIYTFECKECDIEFKGRLSYKKHLRLNHGLQNRNEQKMKVSTPCPYCEKVLANGYIFNIHISLVHRDQAKFHPEIVFKKSCNDCDEKFFNSQDLDKHTRSVHGKAHRTFKCNFCNEKFEDKPSLRAHRLSLHKDLLAESGLTGFVKNIPCPYCPKVYSTKRSVNQHISKSHCDKLELHPEIAMNYSCDICQESFFAKDHIQDHNAKLHGEQYQCQFCDKGFKTKSSRFGHIQFYHANEEHMCEICSKVFKTKQSIKIHMKKVHTAGTYYKFSCSHCAQGAQTEEGLQTHVEKNHQGKQHLCSFCSATFHDNQARSLHEKRMHLEKILSCDQCDQMFSLPHLLKTHMRNVHIKKKDKICPICGEQFFNLDTFRCHLNRHNDSRPFPCEVCGQSYFTSIHLRRHMKTHTLPYSCTLCVKSFATKGILDDHMRKHAGDKLDCRFLCESSYLDRRNRDRHEKTCVNNHVKGTSWGPQNTICEV